MGSQRNYRCISKLLASRRAIMGIGTLIIFIATILVAAVAAGVLISTSGVLQQNSLVVGEQARQRLIDGVDIEQIMVNGNTETRTANNFEVQIRTSAGSNPIQLDKMTMSVFTAETAAVARSMFPANNNMTLAVNSDLTSGALLNIGYDLDGDGNDDSMIIVVNGSNATEPDFIQFNLTNKGASDLLPLGVDLSTTSATMNVEDLPITTQNGDVFWGYIHINGTNGAANAIQASTADFTITEFFLGECTHAKLPPEVRYCVRSTIDQGGDTILDFGEAVFLYFRYKSNNVMQENDLYEIKIFPERGRSSFVQDRIPNVITRNKIFLYP